MVEMLFDETLINGDDVDAPTSFHSCLSAAFVGQITGENLQKETAQFAERRVCAFQQTLLHKIFEKVLGEIFRILSVEAAAASEGVNGQPVVGAQFCERSVLDITLIVIASLKHERPPSRREVSVVIACCHEAAMMAESCRGAILSQMLRAEGVLIDR
jgi:hypothetical protein